jgi:hypothetical protein
MENVSRSKSEFASEPLVGRVFLVAMLLVTGGLFLWTLLSRFGFTVSESKDTAFVLLSAAIFAQAAGPFFARRAMRLGAVAVSLVLLVAFFAAR